MPCQVSLLPFAAGVLFLPPWLRKGFIIDYFTEDLGVRKAGFRPGVETSPGASKRENLFVPRGGSDDPSPAGVKMFFCLHFPAKTNGNGYLNSKDSAGPNNKSAFDFFLVGMQPGIICFLSILA